METIFKNDTLMLMLLLVYNCIVIPEVQLTSSLMVFDLKEEATLQCNAVGGYPPIRNISLMKNGQVILNRVSDKITYTISGGLPKNVYGLYECNVNNTATISSQAILL